MIRCEINEDGIASASINGDGATLAHELVEIAMRLYYVDPDIIKFATALVEEYKEGFDE